jgi:hypothetical protein
MTVDSDFNPKLEGSLYLNGLAILGCVVGLGYAWQLPSILFPSVHESVHVIGWLIALIGFAFFSRGVFLIVTSKLNGSPQQRSGLWWAWFLLWWMPTAVQIAVQSVLYCPFKEGTVGYSMAVVLVSSSTFYLVTFYVTYSIASWILTFSFNWTTHVQTEAFITPLPRDWGVNYLPQGVLRSVDSLWCLYPWLLHFLFIWGDLSIWFNGLAGLGLVLLTLVYTIFYSVYYVLEKKSNKSNDKNKHLREFLMCLLVRWSWVFMSIGLLMVMVWVQLSSEWTFTLLLLHVTGLYFCVYIVGIAEYWQSIKESLNHEEGDSSL